MFRQTVIQFIMQGDEIESPFVGLMAHQEGTMKENEIKVIDLIRRSKDKEKALTIALELLMSLLVQQGMMLEDLPEAS